MENNSEPFSYTYSASQQEEIKRIRQKYIPQEENKMAQLRKLDEGATHLGRVVAIIVGVLSSLVLGIGMSCSVVWTDYFVPDIVIGIIGIAGVGVSFPLYTIITRRQREKLAPQIMKLSQELTENK